MKFRVRSISDPSGWALPATIPTGPEFIFDAADVVAVGKVERYGSRSGRIVFRLSSGTVVAVRRGDQDPDAAKALDAWRKRIGPTIRPTAFGDEWTTWANVNERGAP